MTIDKMLALKVTELTASTKKNDVVSFGPYCWKVLAKEDDRFLLITRDAVCKKAFNEDEGETIWRECTLRQWLNDDFYDDFSDEEKEMIVPTDTRTGRYDSEDNVFLLSYKEAKRYFQSSKDMMCIRGFAKNGRASWWLRTADWGTGNRSCIIDAIHELGGVGDSHRANSEHDVRPAIWVDISANS